MLTRSKQRGDTLIEVLFAITVFSLVVVGSLSIMNQGVAAAQRSLEITLVRQQIDSQAAALRYMHDSYLAVYQPGITFNLAAPTSGAEEWYQLVNSSSMVSSASNFSGAVATCPTIPGTAFVVEPKGITLMPRSVIQPATGYSQIEYNTSGVMTNSRGLWIEAVRYYSAADSTQVDVGYIDFHIRACWRSFGASNPVTLGTIVRLYESR